MQYDPRQSDNNTVKTGTPRYDCDEHTCSSLGIAELPFKSVIGAMLSLLRPLVPAITAHSPNLNSRNVMSAFGILSASSFAGQSESHHMTVAQIIAPAWRLGTWNQGLNAAQP